MTTIPACRAGWSHEHPHGDLMDLSSVCIPLLRSCLQPLSNGTLESCFLNRHANANVSRGFVNNATHKGNKYARRPRHQKCERDKRTKDQYDKRAKITICTHICVSKRGGLNMVHDIFGTGAPSSFTSALHTARSNCSRRIRAEGPITDS